MVPAGTPREIISRLNADLGIALDQPEVRQKLASTGVDVIGGSADAFDQMIKRDYKRFSEALKKAGMKPE